MNASKCENLDFLCAKAGRDIGTPPSSELEKSITNALAVLEEQGVYAMFLFLESNKDKDIEDKLHGFLRKTPKQPSLLAPDEKILNGEPKMFNNLDDLLLSHDLLHRTLVYARYHAKCHEKDKSEVTP